MRQLPSARTRLQASLSTEHADYANGRRHVGSAHAQASRKFESVLNGDADTLKQNAYRLALA